MKGYTGVIILNPSSHLNLTLGIEVSALNTTITSSQIPASNTGTPRKRATRCCRAYGAKSSQVRFGI